MRRAFVSLLLVLAVGRLSAAPPERTHTITPADYATVNQITEIALSPDGKQVAYTLATWNKKSDKRATELWVVATDGKSEPKQLTSDRANDSHPKWSSDGKSVYVLSRRGLPDFDRVIPQVWRIPTDGSDPVAVTRINTGVVAFDYAPKNDTVFFTTDATAIDKDDFSDLRKKYAKIDYGSGKRTVSELFVVKDDEKPKQVYAPNRYIREFAVTQDGLKVALVTAIDDSVIKSEGESRVDVFDMFEGKTTTPPTECYRAKAASPHAWLEGLAWNPDGTRFAFCAIFDAYPAEIVIGAVKDGTWSTALLERGAAEVRGYGSPVRWNGRDGFSFLSDKYGTVVLASAVEGKLNKGFGGTGATYGSVIYDLAHNTPTKDNPPVLVMVTGDGNGLPVLRRSGRGGGTVLVDPNPHTANWKFPSVEHVTWKSSDGASVGGPLELPFGWKKGDKPLPLVVAIHGGPTTSSPNDLRFDPHNGRLYFAAAGYAVLCPNYRGSTGYGDKFVTDLIGNENDIDVKDIVTGIQHLIKEGIADPERIAVMGWSNGGYLTNCLITMKNPPIKIKAASSGAGILDTVAEWGFNDEPAYPVVFKKGTPWEQPEIYKKTSPTYGLGNVTTPTLIHVGANDVRCPPGHSRMLYRALKEYNKVPTQLNVYPNQPHGLGPLSFRTAKMEWDLAWFEKYMKQ